MKGEEGFLILEILIAGLILTASIAATMMIFRGGFQQLERADRSNSISAMLPQVLNLLQYKDLNREEGEETLRPGMVFRWKARLEKQSHPSIFLQESMASRHEIYLYTVHIFLKHGELSREYDLHLLRSGSGQDVSNSQF